ncbi:hypothetical protein ACH0B6_19350 [Solibacillus silvestris]
MKLEYKNLNPENLAMDLKAKGIDVIVNSDLIYGENTAQNIWFEVDELVDVSIIQSIIDAHVPTPVPSEFTIDEKVAVNTDYLLDLDFRLMMLELGIQ